MSDFIANLTTTKARLESISQSFCLAKWLQVTLHLQNGHNHSCHHPDLHRADPKEVRKRPDSLHNTKQKQAVRELMLRGEKPAECEYCWLFEKHNKSGFSDRIVKSAEAWASGYVKDYSSLTSAYNSNPTYLEISFSNICNLRCSYCSPETSSSIWQSYEKHGHFIGRESLDTVISKGLKPIKNNDDNPYLAAFWKWLPDLSRSLTVFRITGGEPLLDQSTFKVLDFLADNPRPKLELCINSNLCIPQHKYNLFIEKVNSLYERKCIKSFQLYTSIDTYEKQAEYIRTGLNYGYWKSNILKFLNQTPFKLYVMCTFNLLSVPSFNKLLFEIYELNRLSNSKNKKRIEIDSSLLLNPPYYSIFTLTNEWKLKIDDIYTFMNRLSEERVGFLGFGKHETHKIERIAKTKFHESSKPLETLRRNFYIFTSQLEKRENKKFLEYFPEMEDFYSECKKDYYSFGLKLLKKKSLYE